MLLFTFILFCRYYDADTVSAALSAKDGKTAVFTRTECEGKVLLVSELEQDSGRYSNVTQFTVRAGFVEVVVYRLIVV